MQSSGTEDPRGNLDGRDDRSRRSDRSRKRYAKLFDLGRTGYLALDEAGVVCEVNHTARLLIDHGRAELVGEALESLVVEADHSNWREHLRRCLTSGAEVISELHLQTGGLGPARFVLSSRRAVAPEGSTIHTVVAHAAARQGPESVLLESREWLQLARAAGVASWQWNAQTNQLNWSDGLFEVCGLPPGSITPTIGDWTSRVWREDRERWRAAVLRTPENTLFDVEIRIQLPSGELRWLNVKGKRLPDLDGQGSRVIGIVTDIHGLKEANQRLQTLHVNLEQRTAETAFQAAQLRILTAELTHAEQRERRRLAELLHDHLQQLLVAGKMSLALARNALKDDGPREFLKQADAVLGEAIAASRSLTVQLSPPVLHEQGFAAGLTWLNRFMDEKHGLTVAVEQDRWIEPAAEEVRIVLFRIVRELLFNVVKHARTREASVTLTHVDRQAEVVVRDEGVGFDPENADRTADSSIGFGLFSVRQRLELLGGQFELHSAPGKGTRVSLRAPLDSIRQRKRKPADDTDKADPMQPAEERHSAGPAIESLPASGKIRILLADDHKVVREGLANLLRQQPDFELVGEAADGAAALELARAVNPEVVVMDISMPRMNGIEATRRITAERPRLRVIGLSMHEKEDMAQAMFDAGACSYLNKGGPPEDLFAAIRSTRAPA